MKNKVLVTGASGLLGSALVKELLKAGLDVYAQYHTRQPFQEKNCRWLHADFSDLGGIREFLKQNQPEFENLEILINNYGPITSKPLPQLTAEDFTHDYHHNLLTAYEITTTLIRQARLKTVINIGFEHAGEQRAYMKILPYAIAKNALLTLTKSLEQENPGIRFHMVNPPTMEGAEVKSKNGTTVAPETIARKIAAYI